MKKTSVICLLILFVCMLLASFASADGSSWYCETCREYRDTVFCPVCGAKKPDTKPDSGSSVWPHKELTRTPVTIKAYPKSKSELRRQAYLGPDKNKYPGGGAYRPAMVAGANALFREGNYIFVDLLYHEEEKRTVYFLNDSLEEVPNSLEFETLTGIPAKVCRETIAMMGPGSDYRVLEISVKSKYANWSLEELVSKFGGSYEIQRALQNSRYTVVLEQGTSVSVFFEYNSWAFAEFDTAIGRVRAWLPADSVTK